MQLERIKDADYCLCELVCTTSRNDYEQLPFHSIWDRNREANLVGIQPNREGQGHYPRQNEVS